MVRIRLRRVGAKNQPSFRVVAADRESPRDGRFLEILGHYNPRTEPATVVLHEDRIYDWMSKGAQPSGSVKQIFRTVGLMDRFERFKAGEEVETLLEEAAAVMAERNQYPKTQRPSAEKRTRTAIPETEEVAEADAPPELEEEPEAELVEEKVEAEVEAEETEAEADPEETEAEAEAEPKVEAEEPVSEAGDSEEEEKESAEEEESS